MKIFYSIALLFLLATCASNPGTSNPSAPNSNGAHPLSEILVSGPQFVGDSIDKRRQQFNVWREQSA